MDDWQRDYASGKNVRSSEDSGNQASIKRTIVSKSVFWCNVVISFVLFRKRYSTFVHSKSRSSSLPAYLIWNWFIDIFIGINAQFHYWEISYVFDKVYSLKQRFRMWIIKWHAVFYCKSLPLQSHRLLWTPNSVSLASCIVKFDTRLSLQIWTVWKVEVRWTSMHPWKRTSKHINVYSIWAQNDGDNAPSLRLIEKIWIKIAPLQPLHQISQKMIV